MVLPIAGSVLQACILMLLGVLVHGRIWQVVLIIGIGVQTIRVLNSAKMKQAFVNFSTIFL
jgi:hypothetical protein